VLVRFSSFARLSEAYHNYFADIGEFVGVVEGVLEVRYITEVTAK
jgi:hypothetical protein